MTRDQAGALLALLQAAHPRTKLEDATLDLWASELRKLDHAIGEAAVRALVDGVKGWPSIAHLNESVQAAREQAARARRDQERRDAEHAFDHFERVPLQDMPAIAEFLERIAVKPPPLELADDGVCDDRCGRTGIRYLFGRVRVCVACAQLRLKAAGKAA